MHRILDQEEPDVPACSLPRLPWQLHEQAVDGPREEAPWWTRVWSRGRIRRWFFGRNRSRHPHPRSHRRVSSPSCFLINEFVRFFGVSSADLSFAGDLWRKWMRVDLPNGLSHDQRINSFFFVVDYFPFLVNRTIFVFLLENAWFSKKASSKYSKTGYKLCFLVCYPLSTK